MSSQYVGDFVAQEQREWAEEQEWHERETESIPAWMDEEKISAREYEGLDEDYGHYAKESDLPDWEEERESAYRIKAW